MGCSSPLVFTDSVGGGGITDTEKGYIGIYTSDRIIINAGTYKARMNSYFTVGDKKYTFYKGICMRLYGYKKIVINGGTFRSGICVVGPKLEVNNGVFKIDSKTDYNNYGVFSNDGIDDCIINHAVIKIDDSVNIDKGTVEDNIAAAGDGHGQPDAKIGDFTWDDSGKTLTIG